LTHTPYDADRSSDVRYGPIGGKHMKVWTKPAVREQEVGLEVTSYLPAEIDII
jgi:coenzyme PQQ precursor peptide PqqA